METQLEKVHQTESSSCSSSSAVTHQSSSKRKSRSLLSFSASSFSSALASPSHESEQGLPKKNKCKSAVVTFSDFSSSFSSSPSPSSPSSAIVDELCLRTSLSCSYCHQLFLLSSIILKTSCCREHICLNCVPRLLSDMLQVDEKEDLPDSLAIVAGHSLQLLVSLTCPWCHYNEPGATSATTSLFRLFGSSVLHHDVYEFLTMDQRISTVTVRDSPAIDVLDRNLCRDCSFVVVSPDEHTQKWSKLTQRSLHSLQCSRAPLLCPFSGCKTILSVDLSLSSTTPEQTTLNDQEFVERYVSAFFLHFPKCLFNQPICRRCMVRHCIYSHLNYDHLQVKFGQFLQQLPADQLTQIISFICYQFEPWVKYIAEKAVELPAKQLASSQPLTLENLIILLTDVEWMKQLHVWQYLPDVVIRCLVVIVESKNCDWSAKVKNSWNDLSRLARHLQLSIKKGTATSSDSQFPIQVGVRILY